MTPRRTPALVALLALIAGPAHAGFDGQSAPAPPTTGDMSDPVQTHPATPVPTGRVTVDASLDLADAPLVRVPDGSEQPQPALDDVLRLRLGALAAVSPRIQVGAVAPVVLTGRGLDGARLGPSLSDLHLLGRVSLAGGAADPDAPNLVFLASGRIPTGPDATYLGDRSLGATALLAGSVGAGPVRTTLNLGAERRGFEPEANVVPGWSLLARGAVGLRLSPAASLSVEARYHQQLGRLDAPVAGAVSARGAEAFLTGRGGLGDTAYVFGSLGGGLLPGYRAPRLGGLIGVGARFGGRAEPSGLGQTGGEGSGSAPEAQAPVPVIVYVQDEAGEPLDADLRVDDGTTVRITAGRAALSLPPGTHRIDVEVDGFGSQARGLDLPVGRQSPEEARFILLPEAGQRSVSLDLGSPEDTPVADATLSVDGRPIGTSASGGEVVVGGLADTPVTVEARAPAFRPRTLTLETATEPAPVEMLLARERGAVQLVVTDPEGEPVQGVRARFAGPDRLGPYALGERASRTFVLRPGAWQVLVDHPDYGLQQRGLDLREADTELSVVRLVLQPPEAGEATLDLRVVDPGGTPIADAEVFLDGTSIGRTASGGSLRLTDLAVGPRRLSVADPDLAPAEAQIVLHEGLQEHLLVTRWLAGSVLFRARGPDGMVPDATVRGTGPTPVAPLPLGKDGAAHTRFEPGDWRFLFSSPTLGLAEQGARVPPDAGSLTVVESRLGPEDAGPTLAVSVVDPEESPVVGASIALDGAELGATATLGTLSIPDAGAGAHELSVDARPFAPLSRRVTLRGERVEERVQLAWGTGAVRVSVRHAGEPLGDATLRIGGPRFVPATPVGPDGSHLFALEPGDWQVLVSSPTLGLRQVPLTVPDRPRLTELEVELAAIDPDAALAIVRAQTPDGTPIPDATVQLDDRTPVPAPGGYATFDDVTPGEHRVSIQAPDFEPVVIDEVDLDKGRATQRIVPMAWKPRPVELRVSGPDGQGVSASVIAAGPEDREAVRTDADGRASLVLDPRDWELLVLSEGLRVGRLPVPARAGAEDLSVQLGPARVTVEGDTLTTATPIYFATGKADIGTENDALLDEVADTLAAHPELVQVEIGGHTDATGSVAANLALSRRRAEAVKEALVDRGVAPERLDAQGYGPTRPVADNATPDGRARNRRVEFAGETGAGD